MITSTNHRMVTPLHHPHHWFQREFFTPAVTWLHI